MNDISPRGVPLFICQEVPEGKTVLLNLSDPQLIEVKAQISWCEAPRTTSHVLSNATFGYRLGLQFVFDSKEKETAFRSYCESLAKSYLVRASA